MKLRIGRTTYIDRFGARNTKFDMLKFHKDKTRKYIGEQIKKSLPYGAHPIGHSWHERYIPELDYMEASLHEAFCIVNVPFSGLLKARRDGVNLFPRGGKYKERQ